MKKSTIPELKSILKRDIDLSKNHPYHHNAEQIDMMKTSIPKIQEYCMIEVTENQIKKLNNWVDKLKETYLG